MKVWIFFVLFLMILSPVSVVSASSSPLAVTISATHSDGKPFVSLWIILILDNNDESVMIARTDEIGRASFAVDPGFDENFIFAKIAGVGSAWRAPYAERLSVAAQDTAIIPNYSFPTFLAIPVEDGVTEYAAAFTMHPSVRASVQLVDEHGQPLAGGAFMQINGFGMDTAQNGPDEAGPLSIGGLRQGNSADVMIAGPQSPQWMVIHLEPHQTLEDVHLGPIHIPPYEPGSIPLHMQLINDDQLSTLPVEWVWGGVTIFTEDGQTATVFARPSNTDPIMDIPSDEVPRIPMLDPGIYYVAPGGLGTSSANLLRRLLLDGVDVEAAGVPKLTAVEGEPIHITVDAVQAEQAIRAAAGQ